MANTRRDPKLEARWRDALRRQRASGLTVQSFCRREGLSESSFYAWRRAIAERGATGHSASQSPMSPEDSRRPARHWTEPAFVPLMFHGGAREQRATHIAIELRCGRVLRLPDSIQIPRLVELIHALEAEPRS
jgi:hypothetical protein